MGAGAGRFAHGADRGCVVVGMLTSPAGGAESAGKDGLEGDGDLLSVAHACRAGAGDARSAVGGSGADPCRAGGGRSAPDALLRIIRKRNPRGAALVRMGRKLGRGIGAASERTGWPADA